MASKQTLSEELLQASENGETERVVTLLRGGADPNYKGGWMEGTALHYASWRGHLEVVQQLLFHHADVNATDMVGDTPLHDACWGGHLKVGQTLLQNNGDANSTSETGKTPLHCACWNYRLDVVKLLITNGDCNVNSQDKDGNTPLHDACRCKNFEVAWYLIREQHCSVKLQFSAARDLLDWAHKNDGLQQVNSGQFGRIILEKDDAEALLLWASKKDWLGVVKHLTSDQHCNVQCMDRFGQTPLHLACRVGHLEVVKHLTCERHYDVPCTDKYGQTPLHQACQVGHLEVAKHLTSERHYDVPYTDKYGQTPLHQACQVGHLEVAKHLTSERHYDVPYTDKYGQTPLHQACQAGHLEVAKHLTSERHYDVPYTDKYGQTPLHQACQLGHLEVVKHITSERHYDVPYTDKYGQTPLHQACQVGHLEVVKHLTSERHYDVPYTDKYGQTPLHQACQAGHLEVVKHLTSERHYDVLCTDKYGKTPLHLACQAGDLEVVKHLTSERHYDVRCTDKYGKTPLHLACQAGHLEVVKHLTSERHYDAPCKDKYGQTPLHLACQNGHAEIVHHFLSERICNVNKDDRTLLNITNDTGTIRELLRHGINPVNVYTKYSSHLPESSPKQPPESAVKIFTVGDHGAGKSTLVKALQKEGSGFSRVAGRLKKVTGVDEKTAGIIPHKVESRFFGHAALYDFAGHKEFYASHAAMIRQSMAGSSTGIFLLLADLRSSAEQFEGSILSWLSFIDNQCPSDPKPHIIIVGSHTDDIKSNDQIAKSNIIDSLEHRDAFTSFEFKGYIAINCCYSQSSSISELRKMLSESCEVLRLTSKPSFNTHCFTIYLLDTFRDLEAVKLKDVLIKVNENCTPVTDLDHAKLLSFIPTDAPRLYEMCEDLHDRGSILLLRNTEKPEESWLILDQATLLKTVPGKVFAPNDFKEHLDLASATGLVPFTKLRDHFPTLDPNMVAQFLCHLEFCQEVTDDEVLQLLQIPLSISCNERVFFFPSLVSIDAPDFQQDSARHVPAHASPTQIWKPNSDYVYNSGWILQCSQVKHHFTPRFLQVLLLRLAFCFALAPHLQEKMEDLHEIQREIYVWKRGICWVTRKGVAALVQMDESGKTVTVLLRCLECSKLQCIHLRSAIIHKALCAREEFCPKVTTSEYFIHPDAIEYPLKLTTELNLFSISQVTNALAAGDPCVIGTDSQPLHLEKLLYFEPYFHLSKTIVLELFDEQKASRDVNGELMDQIAKCFCNKWDDIVNILKLPGSTVTKQAPPNPEQTIVRLLQLWCLHSRKGSYQCLHKQLDQFSVFAGRHPFPPITSSLSAESTAETASEVDSTADNYSTLTGVDEATLDIVSLLEVTAELREAGPAWFDLGLALGLFQHTLESIQNEDDIGHCLTETLAAWLQGRDGAAAPTWRAVVKALLSPAVNFCRLALQISNAHRSSASSSSMTGSEDFALPDVDKAKLDVTSLLEVKSALLAGGRHLAWFELGLALGLYYGTLKVIKSEYSKDDDYLRDTLAAWLEQKDRVPQQGIPSWRSLTRALAHPLVSQQGLAQKIARKHTKVNMSEEKLSTAGKSDLDNSQVCILLDESSSHGGTSQGDEDRCSSECFRRTCDPLTVNTPKQLETMSKDEESTTTQKDVIHALPEEMANTATKIPSVFSSASPTRTPTSPPLPPPSEHNVNAGIISNQQEITRTQDPDTSTTEDEL